MTHHSIHPFNGDTHMTYLIKTTYFDLVALLLAPAWLLLTPSERAAVITRHAKRPARSAAPLY